MQLRRSLIELEDQNVQNSIEVRLRCTSAPPVTGMQPTIARGGDLTLFATVDWYIDKTQDKINDGNFPLSRCVSIQAAWLACTRLAAREPSKPSPIIFRALACGTRKRGANQCRDALVLTT